jgi:molybdopterin converting factor small subunit
MIHVRLYANLTRPQDPSQAEFRVPARPGLTARDVVVEAGVRAGDVSIVMINGRSAELDSPLSDGDRLGLFPAISGG